MNQSFPNKQKHNILGEKIKKEIQIFPNFFCCPLSLVLSLFGHNFCSRALNEKNHIPTKLINFSIFKKNFKKLGQNFSP